MERMRFEREMQDLGLRETVVDQGIITSVAERESAIGRPPTSDRSSRAYIRWVQEVLNQTLGSGLITDGIIGPKTRSAIRSFQQRHGLTVDGIVGPKTEAALSIAVAPDTISPLVLPPKGKTIGETVSGFPQYQKDAKSLPLKERLKIDKTASIVVSSFNTDQPVSIIRLVGYADQDTPRRPDFEKKISGERAQKIRTALADAIDRYSRTSGYPPVDPHLSKRIIWRIFAAGATRLVVRNPRTESERTRNRRVEIFLTATPSVLSDCSNVSKFKRYVNAESEIDDKECIKEFQQCLEKPDDPKECLVKLQSCLHQCLALPLALPLSLAPPPKPRACCILAPTINPMSSDSNLADPFNLGNHGSRGEVTGIIYTGKAGFVDLGHTRDLCDLTEYIYRQIEVSGGIPSTIQTTHGTAIIHTPLSRSSWIRIARAISYSDSFAYEIYSYDCHKIGMHNSSFSPEDLCSNYLGTLLAERAILKGGNFNDAVTRELNRMLTDLDAQTKTESLNAFTLINLCWVEFNGVQSLFQDRYLRRRNFSRIPWQTGHPSDKPAPAWVTDDLGNASLFYAYTFEFQHGGCDKKVIIDAQFDGEVVRIGHDAMRSEQDAGYGPCFDKSRPCPKC